jgi:prepilin-type N-terminal cleavage/methylation domain-containing protein
MKRGFTLIELLVVIAIIAILAAILFPVFARARAAARQTTCLSNLKEIDLSVQMYLEDYDETLPSSTMTGMLGEPTYMCQPYMKNTGILYCPDRSASYGTTGDDACGNINNPYCATKRYGYGWNTGTSFPAGYTSSANTASPASGDKLAANDGLYASWSQYKVPYTWINPTTGVPYNNNLNVGYGKALAAVAAPAVCFMFADSGDTPRQSMSHKRMSSCGAVNSTDMPRHNDGSCFCYVDGHAKYLKQDITPYTNDNSYLGGVPSTPDACTEIKIASDPCQWSADYDGSNNPAHCKGL